MLGNGGHHLGPRFMQRAKTLEEFFKNTHRLNQRERERERERERDNKRTNFVID